MEEVVISILGGVASIEYQTDDVCVSIFDMDDYCSYLYKGEHICVVTDINDNGTVDIKTVGNILGKKDRRLFLDVPAKDLEYYVSDLLEYDTDFVDTDCYDEEL